MQAEQRQLQAVGDAELVVYLARIILHYLFRSPDAQPFLYSSFPRLHTKQSTILSVSTAPWAAGNWDELPACGRLPAPTACRGYPARDGLPKLCAGSPLRVQAPRRARQFRARPGEAVRASFPGRAPASPPPVEGRESAVSGRSRLPRDSAPERLRRSECRR